MTAGAIELPASLVGVASGVEDRIRTLLDEEAARWALVSSELRELVDALAAFVLGGGKRLRPAFCHWAFVGAGGDPDDTGIVDAGAALELLHTFALAHDDVMDGSALRRSRPTVHCHFAGLHRRRAWRGEPRRFGEGVAILVGDLAFVYADRCMAGVTPAAWRIFDELRIELNIGQYLDLVGTAQGRTADEASARRIALYKSGRYTVERPLHLGAALAGRGDLAPGLSAFGDPLGEAFQLRDDVLGTFGDPARTGKPVGEDLREGKPTPLLALGMARAGPDAAPLLGRIGASDLDDDEVKAIQALLVEVGALDESERRIEALVAQAVSALGAVALTAEAGDALAELARYVGRRDR